MGKEEDKIIEQAMEEGLRSNAENLSTDGGAGQSATPSQAARGEAADGQPLLGRDHGGVAPELEEAGDMSTSDGLGGPESGPLGDDHEVTELKLTKAELLCAQSAAKVLLEDAPGDGAEHEVKLRSFVAKVSAAFGAVLLALVMLTSTPTAQASYHMPVRKVAKQMIGEGFVRCPVLLTDLQEYGVPPVFTLFRVRYERRYGWYAKYPRPWPAFRAVTNECLRREGVGGSWIR